MRGRVHHKTAIYAKMQNDRLNRITIFYATIKPNRKLCGIDKKLSTSADEMMHHLRAGMKFAAFLFRSAMSNNAYPIGLPLRNANDLFLLTLSIIAIRLSGHRKRLWWAQAKHGISTFRKMDNPCSRVLCHYFVRKGYISGFSSLILIILNNYRPKIRAINH